MYGAGGGVGTFAVQIAKALGAQVTAVTSTGNLDLVRSIGADAALDYTQEDFVRPGARYDVFFDIGGNRSFADIRRVLAPNGTLVIVGGPSGRWFSPMGRLVKARLMRRFVSQRLVAYIAQPNGEDLRVLKELLEAGKLSPVIDHVYELTEAAEAIRHAETGDARGKVVIRVA